MKFSNVTNNIGRLVASTAAALTLAIGMALPASAMSATEATQLDHSSQAGHVAELGFHSSSWCGWWNGWCGWYYGYYPYPYFGGGGYYPSNTITINNDNSNHHCLQGGIHNHNNC